MFLFHGMFGLPAYANLTVVETEEGAPKRLCGARFDVSGAARHRPAAQRQAGRQPGLAAVWEELVGPSTRNHLWLTNGLAAYSELLWTEHASGPGAMESQARDVMVEALTVDNVPIIQSARLEDYSPELWALTGSKGAAVLNMLRYVIGTISSSRRSRPTLSSSPGNR